MNRCAIPIAVLTLSLAAGAIIYRTISSSRERRVIETNFFSPYFDAIDQGRYPDAWQFHTKQWREKHSLAEFTQHYKELVSSKGKISNHLVWGTNPSLAGMTVDYQIFFDSHLVAVTYSLVPQPDQKGWGIDGAVSSTGTYSTKPYAW